MEKYMYIILPLISLLICQVIKSVIEMIKSGKLDLLRVFSGSGGMPSSHATFTSSLAFLIGFKDSFTSPLFALSMILVCIVAYDAIGVRKEAGLHATILNKKYNKKLKEKIGHSLIEVLAGLTLGFTISFIYYLLFIK